MTDQPDKPDDTGPPEPADGSQDDDNTREPDSKPVETETDDD